MIQRALFKEGRASQLEDIGDYFAFEIADESLFCIKGRDGVIRTFYNSASIVRTSLSAVKGRPASSSAPIIPGHMS